MANDPNFDDQIPFDVPISSGGLEGPFDNIPLVPRPESSSGFGGSIADYLPSLPSGEQVLDTASRFGSAVYDAIIPTGDELRALGSISGAFDGLVGAGKDILGTPWDMAEIGAAAYDILGEDVVNMLPFEQRYALKLSKMMQGTKPSMLELSTDAQKGGAKLAMLATLLAGLAKLLAKGYKISKSVANAVEEAADDVAKKADDVAKKADDVAKKADDATNQSNKPAEPDAKKPYSDSKNRPKYAEGQVDEVWENAKGPDGKVRDPNTGEILEWDPSKPRVGQWDMGHKPGNEYHRLHDDYMNGRISKDEFLAKYRDPNNYRPESVSANRSRKFEQKE